MQRILTALGALAFTLALPALATAQDHRLGDLDIVHPRIFETAATAKTAGGYVTIANDGDTDDALIDARADFPKVQIHESYEQDGVARMRHVPRIELPAGETVELAPGGYHVMFMGLPGPLTAGDEVPVTLIFEKAGEIEVKFKVIERGSEMQGGKMDHGGMDHGGMKQSDND